VKKLAHRRFRATIDVERWQGSKTLLGRSVYTSMLELAALKGGIPARLYRECVAAIRQGGGAVAFPCAPVTIRLGDWLVLGAGHDTGVHSDRAFTEKFVVVVDKVVE
jgi:hypothetical protein